MTDNQLLEELKNVKIFGYVQCDIELPENLRTNFFKFPPMFRNTLVWRNDISDLMNRYAEEEGIITQPRKWLISCSDLQNGNLITPPLWLFLQLGLVLTKMLRFLEYTPKRCFNSFVKSALDARRQEDENPNLNVITKTM